MSHSIQQDVSINVIRNGHRDHDNRLCQLLLPFHAMRPSLGLAPTSNQTGGARKQTSALRHSPALLALTLGSRFKISRKALLNRPFIHHLQQFSYQTFIDQADVAMKRTAQPLLRSSFVDYWRSEGCALTQPKAASAASMDVATASMLAMPSTSRNRPRSP